MIAWPKIEDRYLDLPDGRLHYVEAGHGSPIVLLHGGHGSWTHWIANIAELSRAHRVLALDQPGFAGSFAPNPEYDLDQYAHTVSLLLDALALTGVAVAGFSFGCVVATAVAAREPQRVSHLILVNSPATGDRNPEAERIQRELSKRSREDSLKAGAIGSLRELQLFNHELIDDDLVALMMKNVRGTRRITKGISARSGLLERLKQVRQPVLVVIGREDRHQNYRLEQRCANILGAAPHARIELIEGARHWLAYDRPEVFNSLVLRAIAG